MRSSTYAEKSLFRSHFMGLWLMGRIACGSVAAHYGESP